MPVQQLAATVHCDDKKSGRGFFYDKDADDDEMMMVRW